jgi:cell division inhibitor SepF
MYTSGSHYLWGSRVTDNQPAVERSMSTFWSKTMVYLGLVDEEPQSQQGDPGMAAPSAGVAQGQPASAQVQEMPNQSAGDDANIAPPMATGLSSVAGRRVEPPIAPAQAVRGRGSVRAVRSTERTPVVIMPHSFEEVRGLADNIRERTPVVLDLREVEASTVRRVVDFATGLTYALDGSMRKVGTGLILVLPARISLGRDEKRRLAEAGLYELEIDQ